MVIYYDAVIKLMLITMPVANSLHIMWFSNGFWMDHI